MEPIIRFDEVTYDVGGRSILRRMRLDIEAGETLVLLGRSGSGKTTALKMINRLLTPTSGRVMVEDSDTAAVDPIVLRRRIGYVIQEVGLFPHWTVAKNIGLVPRLEQWDPARIDQRVAELLTSVGLNPSEFGDRYPRQLSGGQRQRVGIARALAAHPPILLFDEPFGALDPITRHDLQNELLRLRREFGVTAVFVTHDVQEALRIGSRIAVLNNGELESIHTPDEFVDLREGEGGRFVSSLYRSTA
jgi:osmoprotectant transport system ATP-binding protein